MPDPTPIRPHTSGGEVGSSAGGGGTDVESLEQTVSLLRARIDEEFQISNRLDSKHRQAFGLATAFFAIVQTVAFSAMDASGVTSGSRYLIGAAAILAGMSLGAVALRLIEAEGLRPEDDLDPGHLLRWYQDASESAEFLARVVVELRVVADRRHDSNQHRAGRVYKVQHAAMGALALTTFELFIALGVRTLGG